MTSPIWCWPWLGAISTKPTWLCLSGATLNLPDLFPASKEKSFAIKISWKKEFLALLSDDAARDLEDIYDYIELHDSRAKANLVLERIEKAFSSLPEKPEHGFCPRELIAFGLREFCQVFFNPAVDS
ncbi:MAG: type II toxin-antitoxin system RelE/ParE family toxin [Desulfatitalea sp.]|nr:type II toxin-antitoxin system RelE/ParE family toxin [Desulfatitalea sp.]NNJ99616.1 type II toxin-antitoxin system RelE/ParE family toxin [Desulfatitalea sp.]